MAITRARISTSPLPEEALLGDALADCLARAGLVIDRDVESSDPAVHIVVGDAVPTVSPTDRVIRVISGAACDPHYAARLPSLAMSHSIFCLQDSMVRRLRADGLAASHFQIGSHPVWCDQEAPDPDREVDVSFCGPLTHRTGYFMSALAGVIHRWSSRILFYEELVKVGELTGPPAGGDYIRLISSSKMNLQPSAHPNLSPSPVALHIAACSGTVVVTDGEIEDETFRSGTHLISSRTETIPLLVRLLLRNPDRLKAIREAAEVAARSRRLEEGLDELLERATSPDRGGHPIVMPALLGEALSPTVPPQGTHSNEEEPSRTLKSHGQTLKQMASRISALEFQVITSKGSAAETVDEAPASPVPDVSVLITLYNYESFVTSALESALLSEGVSVEVVVVDDASTDASLEMVSRFKREHPDAPITLVSKRVNQGLASARNTALEWARSDLVFILDADNIVFPTGIARLRQALQADPDAMFSYGMLQVFSAAGPVGVMSELGWDPRRVTRGNYIDAMALLRKDRLLELGGYDSRFDGNGHSDYAVWLKLIEEGGRGTFVPEFVGAYRRHGSSMLSTMPLEGARPMVEEVFKHHLRRLRKERLHPEGVD